MVAKDSQTKLFLLETRGVPMKKGRHRRYEEARAFKQRSDGDDIESLMGRLDEDPFDLPVTEAASDTPEDSDEDVEDERAS